MDKTKKKRIKRYITWACMALVVIMLTVMPLLAKREAEKDGPQASLISAAVEQGSITTAIHGGGTLEDEGTEDVIIPTGVKITEFLVKNGDVVQEGTPVAAVDKTSVMAAITSVNETMDFLRDELENGRNEKVESILTAVPGGRVKKIFAQPGETVQEVMLRDGALAVLSIDSMMAVQYEVTSTLATGENVDVTLQDGTTVTGRVESNLDGTVVVTVDDEGYEVGSKVKVEGLGDGTLFIHNAWKATGYAGTISQVYAKEEQTLAAGANLFQLDDREFEGQLQHRANQHREYEELLQTLLKMYESGTIDAPCGGVISGVDEDSAFLLAAEEDTWEVELLGAETPKYRIVLLSNTSTCTCGNKNPHDPSCPESCSSATREKECPYAGNDHKSDCIEACNPTNCTATGAHKSGCITFCKEAEKPEDCPNQQDGNHKDTCICKCNPSAKTEAECPGTGYHYDTCIKKCESCDEGKDCPAKGTHKTDCIERCAHVKTETDTCDATKHYADCIKRCKKAQSAGEPCPAVYHYSGCYYYGMTYTATAAKVMAKGTSALVVLKEKNPTVYNVEKAASGWTILGAQLNTRLLVQDGVVPASNADQFQEGDIILVVTGKKGDQVTEPQVVLYMRSLPDAGMMMPNMDLSGMMGNFSGFGNYAGVGAPQQQETESLHDLSGSTLLTVTPHQQTRLSIPVDEQDISKIKLGMQAAVKVEALKNQTFSGEVTQIGIHGANNGGSSKYTVDILLDVAGDMISGMSASASIPLETKENVLRIPVAALDELDGKTVAYTALDKDSGEPTSPVEVVTGVSDGEYVEILGGLSLGDTVHYYLYDTLEVDTSAKAEKFTFGG